MIFLSIFCLRKSRKLVFTPVEKIMSFTWKAFGTHENSGNAAGSIVGLALKAPAPHHIENRVSCRAFSSPSFASEGLDQKAA